jgi:hypothetical protein
VTSFFLSTLISHDSCVHELQVVSSNLEPGPERYASLRLFIKSNHRQLPIVITGIIVFHRDTLGLGSLYVVSPFHKKHETDLRDRPWNVALWIVPAVSSTNNATAETYKSLGRHVTRQFGISLESESIIEYRCWSAHSSVLKGTYQGA